jgi:hypothetical protein
VLRVEQAGIDTWSVAWRIAEDSPAARAMTALASVTVRRGRALPDSVAGHRVGWFPGHRLLFAEGHPGEDGRLGSPAELAAVVERVTRGLADCGIQAPRDYAPFDRQGSTGFLGVRRLDVTADLRFENASVGLGSLQVLARMQLPRAKTATYMHEGHVETVAFHARGSRRILARWYDKGIEAGSHPRGELVRPEDQRRFGAGARRLLEDVDAAYLRDRWHRRFLPLWQANGRHIVAGRLKIARELERLTREGKLTPAHARALAGTALFETEGVRFGPTRTRQRHQRWFRKQGIIIVPSDDDDLSFDFNELGERVLDEPNFG